MNTLSNKTLPLSTYQNPLTVGADPFVLAHEGRYYLYATNADDGFRVLISEDMSEWTDMGYCLKKGDVIGEKWFWAPEIIENNGKFYMVYVAEEHLAIAVSDSPLGPFVQAEKKWLSEEKAIDGHFFRDDDGTVYLYYVRFDNGNVIYMSTMKNDVFRRDEIWFAALDEEHSSDLYSLYEIRKEDGKRVNHTASYDKQYLEGRYGADPYLRTMLNWEDCL